MNTRLKRRGNASKTAAVALTLLLLIVNMASVFALGPPGPTFFINVNQLTQKITAGEPATYNVDLTAWAGQFNVTVGLAERRRADWQQLSPLPTGVEAVYPKQIYIKTGSEDYRFPVVVKTSPDMKESTVDIEILVVGRYVGEPIGVVANIRLYVVPRITSLSAASTVFYEGFDKWSERGDSWIVNSKGGSVGMYDLNDPGIDYPGTPDLGWSMYHPYASLRMTKNFLDYAVGAERPIPRLNGSFVLEFAMRPDEKRINFTFDLTDTLQNTGIYAELLDGNLMVQGRSYGTYSTAQWYKFRFENNATSRTIQWYLNGKYMDSLPFTGAPDRIKTEISGSGVGTGYIDDIFLQKVEGGQLTLTTVISNNTASTASWLPGWNYRKSHIVNSAPAAGNNYQVEITVHRANGVDYGKDVYLNYRSLNWPNDIRFTGKDGVTELNYWLEDASTDTATFWVKVNDDLSYSSTTIYVYYGRSNVSSASNGDNTFAFFDDFSGGAIDRNKWTVVGKGTWSIDNGSMKGEAPMPHTYADYLEGSYSPTTDQLLHVKVKVSSINTNSLVYYRFQNIDNFITGYLQIPNLFYMSERSSGYWNEGRTSCNWSPDTWYTVEVIETPANSFTATLNGACKSTNVAEPITGKLGLFPATLAPVTSWFDDVYVRKYVTPEPQHGSWGGEQPANSLPPPERPVTMLSGWSYRKSHVINNAPGAGTGYQIRIVVHKGSGIDQGENVYLNNHALTWPNDIRFIDSDGLTQLSYWLESSDSNSATFWVRVKDDLSARSATIYVYYGRPYALSVSNGGETFEFFDDFSGSTLDTSKWSIQSASTSLSNSILTVTNPSSTFSGIRSANSIDLSNWRAVEARVKWDPVSETNHFSFGLFDTAGPTIWWNGYSTHYYAYPGSPDNNVYAYVCDGNCDARATIVGGYDNSWHRLKITARVAYEPTLWWDGSPYHIDRNLAGTIFYFWPAKAYDELNKQIQIDWVFIRKIAPTEPSQGSWGREETTGVQQPPNYSSELLSEWGYRKSHVVTHASDAGLGYQIKITVHKGSGTDSGADVYLNNHALNWPNDIRFTDKDGVTELNYWLEDSDSSVATFWVKVKDDLSFKDTTVYIYYGQADAQSASNGNNVFAFFDDFSGSSIDTSKWKVIGTGEWSIDNGAVRGTRGTQPGHTSWDDIIEGSYSPGVHELLHAKIKLNAGDNNGFVYYRFKDADNIITGYLQIPNLLYMSERISGYWEEAPSNCDWSPNTWYTIEVAETTQNTFTATLNGACAVSNTLEPVTGNLGLFPGGLSEYITWWDNVYVRKYASPEPSQGIWGSEEQLSEQQVTTTSVTSIRTVIETTAVTSTQINIATITQSTTLTSAVTARPAEQAAEPLTSAWAIGATIIALALTEVLLLKRTR